MGLELFSRNHHMGLTSKHVCKTERMKKKLEMVNVIVE